MPIIHLFKYGEQTRLCDGKPIRSPLPKASGDYEVCDCCLDVADRLGGMYSLELDLSKEQQVP